MLDRDITLRGSGELMHLIKDKSLNIIEIIIFCALIWRVNENGECDINSKPLEFNQGVSFNAINKLASLGLLKRIDNNSIMLNPHVAGIGDAKKRGELRLKFKNLT